MDLHNARLIIATDCPGLRLRPGSVWRVVDVAPIGASVRLGIKSCNEPRTVVLWSAGPLDPSAPMDLARDLSGADPVVAIAT